MFWIGQRPRLRSAAAQVEDDVEPLVLLLAPAALDLDSQIGLHRPSAKARELLASGPGLRRLGGIAPLEEHHALQGPERAARSSGLDRDAIAPRHEAEDAVERAVREEADGAARLTGGVVRQHDLRRLRQLHTRQTESDVGGLLDEAIKVADIFLESGRIVSIKGRRKPHSRVYVAHSDKDQHPYPIVLLINQGSASASEIVAGALQDHGRSVILGTTSFGKGSVQTVEPLRDGSGLKLTIARYYTPDGHAIQARGIIPHVVVANREVAVAEEKKLPHMTEKDLKNHISAQPKEDLSKEMKQKILDRRGVKVPGEEAPDVVKRLITEDKQVQRALDILTSWQIFSKMSP